MPGEELFDTRGMQDADTGQCEEKSTSDDCDCRMKREVYLLAIIVTSRMELEF